MEDSGEPREFANKLLDDWLQHRSRKMNRPHMREHANPILRAFSDISISSLSTLFRPSGTPTPRCSQYAPALGH